LLGVIETLSHRIGLGSVLTQDPEVELVRPPVFVRPHANIRGPVHDWALARFFAGRCVHVFLRSWSSSLRTVGLEILSALLTLSMAYRLRIRAISAVWAAGERSAIAAPPKHLAPSHAKPSRPYGPSPKDYGLSGRTVIPRYYSF